MIWMRSWRVQCILYVEKIFFNTPVIKTENIVSNNYKTEKKYVIEKQRMTCLLSKFLYIRSYPET